MNKNLTFLFFISLFIAQSCTSIKSTFNEDYTTKLNFAPDQHAVMSSDNESIFLIGTTKSIFSTNTRISKVNAANGQTEWSETFSNLGNMPNEPDNIILIEEKDIALVFGYNPGNILRPTEYMFAAFDMNSKRELWSRVESSGTYSMGGLYLPQNQSFLIQTRHGMQAFDISTGEILWNIDDLSTRINLGRLSLTLQTARDINFIFLEEMERLLLEVQGKVSLFNPYTGEIEWQIDERIGNYLDADIFEEAGYAVFYGRNLSRSSRDVARSSGNRSTNLSTVARTAQRGLERGAENVPLIFIDIESGRILWRSSFYSNGHKQLYLTEDKLLLTGIVSYAFDLRTGEKTWQNVSDDRLGRESLFGVFAEFTGIDYTTDSHRAGDAVVLDNTVFVVFPEVLEQGGNRNRVSIRSYDYLSGEELWKSSPERMEVRDMFLEEGILFVVVNGRFSVPSRMIAFDAFTGEELYELDARRSSFLNTLTITDEIIYHLDHSRNLNLYSLENGQLLERNILGRSVIRLDDLGDRLMVVYSMNRGSIIAFHDRNSFDLIDQVNVPFYSRNIFMVNNKLFMVRENPEFKGIVYLDLDEMVVHGHASVSTSFRRSSSNKNAKQVLDPYKFIISNDASHIFLVRKKKLVRYSLDP